MDGMASPDYIPRRCVERTNDGREQAPKRLADLRDLDAYILLGEPGAGKTTCFRREAQECEGTSLSVANFQHRNEERIPSHWDTPLFIDGLDEATDADIISRVCGKLESLGKPRMRLSCRAADWYGVDTGTIKDVYPGVKIFHLEPLSKSEQRRFLKALGVTDVDGMLADIEQWLFPLGGNPLLLGMLPKIWGGGKIKNKNIKNLYEAICRRLVQEHDPKRKVAARKRGWLTPSPERLMRVAGEVCVAMLCSDKAGFAEEAQWRYAGVDELLHKDEDGTLHREVLTSKLFVSEKDGVYAPWHRSIAEFLGGRHLAGLVDDKKMSHARAGDFCGSADGGVVSGLRGMHAWLSTCAKTPKSFLKTDAFAVASLGGFLAYSPDDQLLFLQCLLEQSGKNRDGYALTSRHYGMLGALPTVADAVKRELTSKKRDHKQQDKAYLLLKIMEKAHVCTSSLNDVLMKTLTDESWHGEIRARAAVVLGKQAKSNNNLGAALHDYAKKMNGKQHLSMDEEWIMNKLLESLYPEFIPASDIANYHLHCSGRILPGFWYNFPERNDVTGKEAREVLDQMGASITNDFAARLFSKAISDDVAPRRVWRWLDAYAGKHKRVPESLRKCIAGDSRLFFGLLDIAREKKRGDVPAFFWFFQNLRECADAEKILDYLWNNTPADEHQNRQAALDYAYRHSGWKRSEAKQKVNSCIGEDSAGLGAHRDFRSGLAKSLKQHASHEREWRRQDRQHRTQEDAQTRKYWAYVRKSKPEIKSGENILLLSEFAFYSVTKGDKWEELLRHVDEADIKEGCVAAVKNGNAQMSPQDIFAKARASKHDGWEFIYRLGMDVIHQHAPDYLLALPCDTVRRAVAFAVVGSGGDWMNYLKANRRELVAQTVKPLFNDGFDGITNFDLWVEKNGDVFASQERRELLGTLMHNPKGMELFRAILRVSIKQKDIWLTELIGEQMRVSPFLPQCGLLSAAGFSLANKPEECADAAHPSMVDEKFRRSFFSFFRDEELHHFSARRQGLFVGLFAPFVKMEPLGTGWRVVDVDSPMEQARMVHQLINALGEKGAVKELDELVAAAKDGAHSPDSCWEHWLPQLEYLQERAVVVDRDDQYSPPSVSQVVASLRGDAPASDGNLRDILMGAFDGLREATLKTWLVFMAKWLLGPLIIYLLGEAFLTLL